MYLGSVRDHGDLGDRDPELSSHALEKDFFMIRLIYVTSSPESVPWRPLLSRPSLKSPVMAVTRSG